MPILRLKNSEGEWSDVPALKGKSAFDAAVEGGFSGTEEQFNTVLSQISTVTRGSLIFTGVSVTGTDELGMPFETGLSEALVQDLYINTNTKMVYQCVHSGGPSEALWSYKFTM